MDHPSLNYLLRAKRFMGIFLSALLFTSLFFLPPSRAQDKTQSSSSANATNVLEETNSSLRRYPYPFAGVFTMVSDSHPQPLSRGIRVHEFLNETLGLPLSDSVWVQGRENDWAFFTRGLTLNDRVGGDPRDASLVTYGEILRQWHAGNVDHFHMWMSDGSASYEVLFRTSDSLNDGSIELNGVLDGASLGPGYLNILEVQFSEPLPFGTEVTFRDTNGTTIHFDIYKVAEAKPVHLGSSSSIYSFMLNEGHLLERKTAGNFDVKLLDQINVKSSRCSNNPKLRGCKALLKRLEFKNFSRATVAAQSSFLDLWGIRPLIATSHGGLTLDMNIGDFSIERYTGEIISPQVETIERTVRQITQRHASAGDVSKPEFHTDLLYNLGLRFVRSDTLVGQGRSKFWYKPYKYGMPAAQGDFYHLWTDVFYNSQSKSSEEYADFYQSREKSLISEAVEDQFCDSLCTTSQGGGMGLISLLGISRIMADELVEQVWYTHYSTQPGIADKPQGIKFRPKMVSALERLANHYRNYSGTIPQNWRLWVTPAPVIPRYLEYRKLLDSSVSVKKNTVKIVPVYSEITKEMIPNIDNLTSDLQGFTAYVDNTSKARIFVDDDEIKVFTRNLADETGRVSVSIVDNTRPTRLIGLQGDAIKVERGRQDLDARQVILNNTSHVTFQYSGGGFFVEISTDDQSSRPFIIADNGLPEEILTKLRHRSSGLALFNSDVIATGGWKTSTVALDQAEWNTKDGKARPDLPIGMMQNLTVGSPFNRSGVIRTLDVLRMNGTAPLKNNAVILGGRVTRNGQGVASIPIKAVSTSGSTYSGVSDIHGYYVVPDVTRGDLLSVSAVLPDRECFPVTGAQQLMLKPEVMTDFDLVRCGILKDTPTYAFLTSDLQPRDRSREVSADMLVTCDPVSFQTHDVIVSRTSSEVRALLDIGTRYAKFECNEGGVSDEALKAALAALFNNIRSDYQLKPGQLLSLDVVMVLSFDEYDVPQFDQAKKLTSLQAISSITTDNIKLSFTPAQISALVKRRQGNSAVITQFESKQTRLDENSVNVSIQNVNPVVSVKFPNAMPFSDFKNGVPEVRGPNTPVVSTDGTPLMELGYEKGIKGSQVSSSNYFRYRNGSDLQGKRIVSFFVAYTIPGSETLKHSRAFMEVENSKKLSNPDQIDSGIIDEGEIQIVWQVVEQLNSGSENYLFGIQQPLDSIIMTAPYVLILDSTSDVKFQDVYSAYKKKIGSNF